MNDTPHVATPPQEDSAHLKDAFASLYAGLREAKRLFEAGDDAGRQGAIHAVETCMKFLFVRQPVDEEGLLAPLLGLQNALLALDDGRTLPIVTAIPRRGGQRGSALRNCLKGAVVFTVERLETLGLKEPKARRAVASVLAEECVASAHGVVTRRTVREWAEAVAADVGRHGEAARTYDGLVAKFPIEVLGFCPDGAAARRACLAELRAQIRRTRGAEELYPQAAVEDDKKPS